MKLIIFFIICVVYLLLTVIHKDDNKFKSVKKKVRFDLDKNNIIIIPRSSKSESDKNNYSEIKTKKKIDNSYEYLNFQKEYVRKLDENRQKSDDMKNIFKNQKPYWESLEIDLNRSYDNYQVNNFNNIRNENIRGKNISDVFNNLTYSTEISNSNLLHHDLDVLNKVLYLN